jgi:hypothetical protein
MLHETRAEEQTRRGPSIIRIIHHPRHLGQCRPTTSTDKADRNPLPETRPGVGNRVGVIEIVLCMARQARAREGGHRSHRRRVAAHVLALARTLLAIVIFRLLLVLMMRKDMTTAQERGLSQIESAMKRIKGNLLPILNSPLRDVEPLSRTGSDTNHEPSNPSFKEHSDGCFLFAVRYRGILFNITCCYICANC